MNICISRVPQKLHSLLLIVIKARNWLKNDIITSTRVEAMKLKLALSLNFLILLEFIKNSNFNPYYRRE